LVQRTGFMDSGRLSTVGGIPDALSCWTIHLSPRQDLGDLPRGIAVTRRNILNGFVRVLQRLGMSPTVGCGVLKK